MLLSKYEGNDMAQRGGSGSERGPGKGQAYGVASVTMAMEGVDFPAQKQDLIDEYGDEQINWTKDNPMRLRDILQKVNQNEFNSMSDLTAAVGQAVKGTSKGETRVGSQSDRGGRR
jgi:hypothetical protein